MNAVIITKFATLLDSFECHAIIDSGTTVIEFPFPYLQKAM